MRRRRSAIDIHPIFSEAPRLRSSIPHPKTDFSKNQHASRRIIPWPKPTKRFFFEMKIGIPTIWDQGTTSFGNKTAQLCYFCRRTGRRKLHGHNNYSTSGIKKVAVYVRLLTPRFRPGSQALGRCVQAAKQPFYSYLTIVGSPSQVMGLKPKRTSRYILEGGMNASRTCNRQTFVVQR